MCPGRETLDGLEGCLDQADVLVIPLCPETVDDPRVHTLAAAAARAGKRVVGIWLGEEDEREVPPFLDRVGSAAVPMATEKVRSAVFGREAIWESPTGKARPPQLLPRKKKC